MAGADALWRAYLGWREAAGPLADFVLPTPFLFKTTPRLAAPGGRRAPRHSLAGRLADGLVRHEARELRAGRAIVFLEAPPRLALATAAALHRHAWRVAPAFGRWPIADAVLPGDALAAWLVGAPPSRPPTETETVPLCLLLDAERQRRVTPATLRRRFDNRYDYGAQMFPPPGRLRAWGVTRAVCAGPAAALAPDLQEYAGSLVSAGLLVELVRLADLVTLP